MYCKNTSWLWGEKIRPRKILTRIIRWAGIIRWAEISRWAGMTQVPGSQVHVPGKCLEFAANWFTFPVAFR